MNNMVEGTKVIIVDEMKVTTKYDIVHLLSLVLLTDKWTNKRMDIFCSKVTITSEIFKIL